MATMRSTPPPRRPSQPRSDTRTSYHVGRPWMFDGKMLRGLTGTPMRRIAFAKSALADAEPDPLTFANLTTKSLTDAIACIWGEILPPQALDLLAFRRKDGGRRRAGTRPFVEPELAHEVLEAHRLLLQLDRRRGGVLYEARILLREALQLDDGPVDAIHAVRLLARSDRDDADQLVRFLYARAHVAQRAAGLVHEARAFVHGGDRGLDEALNLARGFGAALRESAYFLRHHREAAALLARARGFDRRVEREDVRLERDAVDDRDDVADALGARLDLVHRGGRAGRHLRPASRLHGRGRRELARRASAVRVLPHRRRKLLDRGGDLLERGGLVLRALGQVHVVGGQPVRRDARDRGAATRLPGELGEIRVRHAKRLVELPHLAAAGAIGRCDGVIGGQRSRAQILLREDMRDLVDVVPRRIRGDEHGGEVIDGDRERDGYGDSRRGPSRRIRDERDR